MEGGSADCEEPWSLTPEPWDEASWLPLECIWNLSRSLLGVIFLKSTMLLLSMFNSKMAELHIDYDNNYNICKDIMRIDIIAPARPDKSCPTFSWSDLNIWFVLVEIVHYSLAQFTLAWCRILRCHQIDQTLQTAHRPWQNHNYGSCKGSMNVFNLAGKHYMPAFNIT